MSGDSTASTGSSPRPRVAASPRLRERRIDLPPYTLWEQRAGESGTPVVLVHGLSGSSRWWKKNLPALAERHRVAAIDLSGFGKTRGFRRSTVVAGFDSMVETLARWIRRSFDEPVHLVGHSMGGHLAIHFAARHPDLVRSLVLVNTTGIPFDLTVGARLRNAMYPVLGLFSFSPVLFWDFLRAGPTSVAMALARLVRDDARESMHRITAPTLVIWGERDPLLPLSYAQQVKDSIPHASMVILPAAGHVSMWDRPFEFNSTVLAFLGGVDSRPLDDDEGERGRGGEGERVEGKKTADPRIPTSPRHPLSLSPPQDGWGVAGCVRNLCYRQSGPDPRVLLIHGLGIGTWYFAPLGRELHQRGATGIAPDLPGCGHSVRSGDPVSSWPELVLRWMEELQLPPMLMIGHSTGCQLVADLVKLAPERCRGAVYLSPIWNRHKQPWFTLGTAMIRDAVLEPPRLVAHALASFWNNGVGYTFRLTRHYLADATRLPDLDSSHLVIYGDADLLIDRDLVHSLGAQVKVIPGRHGLVFSSPRVVVNSILVDR